MTQTADKTGNWGRWGADDERGALIPDHPRGRADRHEGLQDGKVYNLGSRCRATARRCSPTAGRRSGSRSPARPTRG